MIGTGDVAGLSDVELLAAVPKDEWAFPEFYLRHFDDLAGWLCRATDDPRIAHDLAVETMASAFRHAIKPRRRRLREPREWVFGLAGRELERWRAVGTAAMPNAEALGLLLPVDADRLDAVTARARELPSTDGLDDEASMKVIARMPSVRPRSAGESTPIVRSGRGE